MQTHRKYRAAWLGVLVLGGCLLSGIAAADDGSTDAGPTISNKLLLTGGVSNIEGSAGGGLTPWAVIGGYGTADEIGVLAARLRIIPDSDARRLTREAVFLLERCRYA